ncbi:hypothetical protein FOL46_005615 [Perkinsus olseni]|uniref:Uncharacterized protein n=1 Tax=Perkinsus olseni TaxID=32597 RepID=A0A7J6LQZ1_PEROL|nr:hypothetical protein FOL46_005615 [Perkinsus olseni]
MPPKPKPGKKKKKRGFWDNDDDINVISENTSYDLIKLDYPSEYLSEHEVEPYPRERLRDLGWPGEVPFVREDIESYCACVQDKRILIAGDSLLRGVYSAAVEFLKGDRNYCDDRSIPGAERSRCSGDGKYWHDVRTEEAKGEDLRRCERVMKNEGSPCYAGKVEGLCGGNASLFFTWQPNKRFGGNFEKYLEATLARDGRGFDWIIAGMGFHELARVLRMKGGCADAACRFRKMPEGFGNLYRQFVRKFYDELIPGFSTLGGVWVGMYARNTAMALPDFQDQSNAYVLWLNSLARNETSRQSEKKYLDIYDLTLHEPFRSYTGDGVHFLRQVSLAVFHGAIRPLCPSVKLPSRFESTHVRMYT